MVRWCDGWDLGICGAMSDLVGWLVSWRSISRVDEEDGTRREIINCLLGQVYCGNFATHCLYHEYLYVCIHVDNKDFRHSSHSSTSSSADLFCFLS